MNTTHFKQLISAIIFLSTIWIGTIVYLIHKNPKPIIAINDENAACCSDEIIISIYEQTQDLQTTYNLIQKHITQKDSINQNAISIITMYNDSINNSPK